MVNLMIKGICSECGYDFHLTPQENEVDTYHGHCICGAEGEVLVTDTSVSAAGMALFGARAPVAAKAAASKSP